jgi:hypothetical protein
VCSDTDDEDDAAPLATVDAVLPGATTPNPEESELHAKTASTRQVQDEDFMVTAGHQGDDNNDDRRNETMKECNVQLEILVLLTFTYPQPIPVHRQSNDK